MTTIKSSEGSPFARVLGVGSYTPSRVVDNAEVCTWIDSSDEWIRTRSGISERRWATDEETVAMMGTAAAEKALQHAGIAADQIDAVIVATVSHFHQTPGIAPKIALDVGAVGAPAYDISAACAGFCYAIAQADALVRSGAATHVLAIGVERLSDLTNKSDRSTAFIFADGAGAAVVGPSDTPGIGPVVWGSDAARGYLIYQSEEWGDALKSGEHPTFVMDGNPVFKWAAFELSKKAGEALEKAGITAEELDVFVPHQANGRITDAMKRSMGLTDRTVISQNIAHCGNSSAASIPAGIDALYADGAVHTGQTCLIIGFGAGLVYAGQVIVLP
ncbi:beta-ketoacyl-ACP synthase III [Enemella sp. A6]|uniref:beta-ketoacyl-ACP synthase III n=1 Tax=Enemella sp. A6 TaxID=3440152 RepID=UPI003EC00AEA